MTSPEDWMLDLAAGPSIESVVLDFRNWVLDEGLRGATMDDLVRGAGERLTAAGVPIDRFFVSVRVLQATVIARSTTWHSNGAIRHDSFDWAERDAGLYERSPIKVAQDTREWVSLFLAEIPNDAYGIVPDLKEQGMTHYIVAPMYFTNGAVSAASFATRAPNGFGNRSRLILEGIMPSFGRAVELIAMNQMVGDVLSIYVGEDPARQILEGSVHRGQITHIRSAILFADMRDYTRRSNSLSAADISDLLNEYYDCVVPHIEAEGGHVLKFMGDGILAIFPDEECGKRQACRAALRAARKSILTVTRRNADTPHGDAFTIGIALHHGRAAYGNVGSGERLDFTVIGRDINLTDRIQKLNSKFSVPILASKEFAALIDEPMTPLGRHVVRSYESGLEVFEPNSLMDVA
ncbi:MAG: adenylate/guanylate cyclase domain-containing protein [Pseudomonadota bacterium]